MRGTRPKAWRGWLGAALLLAGAAVALVLLRIDLGPALAGVAIVAVGVGLVAAQVAVVGSWLPRRDSRSEGPTRD